MFIFLNLVPIKGFPLNVPKIYGLSFYEQHTYLPPPLLSVRLTRTLELKLGLSPTSPPAAVTVTPREGFVSSLLEPITAAAVPLALVLALCLTLVLTGS